MEVTISLFNHTSTIEQEKVIKIKPIDEILPNQKKALEKRFDDEQQLLKNKRAQLQKDLERLKQEKEQLMENTAKEIEEQKGKWEQEKQAWIEKAEEEGFKAGFERGKKESIKKYETMIDEANKLVDLATKDYHKTLETSDEAIVQLAIKTAEKIVKKQIDDYPEYFLSIVHAAIEEIKDQSTISIYLHPTNYEFVLNQKHVLSQAVDGDTKISIYIDPKLNVNDCLIVHPFGQIDASVDTQLQQIEKALEEVALELK